MTIYHVEFAKTGTGMSGGEVCMIELIKYLSDQGHSNILLTTDNGEKTYRDELPSDTRVEYQTIKSFHSEKYGPLMSYATRVMPAIKLALSQHYDNQSVIICHSEFFPNSLAFWRVTSRFKKLASIYFYHARAPRILRGFEGEFSNIFHMPNLRIIHYNLNQWLARCLTPTRTTILTVNKLYMEHLNESYPKNRKILLSHFGGGFKLRAGNGSLEKEFDYIWVGRFQGLKRLSDFVKVIAEIKTSRPRVKAVVLGGGNDAIEAEAKELATKLGVRENINFAGFVTGEEKQNYYLKSKIFLMTSCYESFGLVLLEAMSCGLPVVAYDLPVYGVFGDAILRVPIFDTKKMTKTALQLLEDAHQYELSRGKSLRVAGQRSWGLTGEKILEECNELVSESS